MKYIKNNNETIVILNKEEINIISAALTSRMIKLGLDRKEHKWADILWEKTLNLQCEWFNIENN